MMKKIIKQRNKSFYSRNNFLKVISFLLVLTLWVGVSNLNVTYAYFTDDVDSTGNTFTAGTLGINVTSNDLDVIDLGVSKDYSVINQGSLPFRYSMTSEVVGGSDITFCGQLNINVLKGTTSLYTGSLNGFNFNKLINSGEQDDLSLKITDTGSNSAGKVCSFKFNLEAWQDELDFSQGFTDTDFSEAVVYSANTPIPPVLNGVVLNEFLPNPSGLEYGFNFGEDGDTMPQGEWIELYNNGSTSVDLTGWYIKDLANHTINITSANTKPATTIIPSHGWLVVYINSSILNNTDPETITLYNSSAIQQDTTSYSGGTYCDMKPTQGEENSTNPTGHCTSVLGNKSYARIPDGVGAWVDPIPTPGEPNELTEETVASEELLLSEEILPEKKDEVAQEGTSTALTELISDIMGEPAKKEETNIEEQEEKLVKEEPVILEPEVAKVEPKEEVAKEEPITKEEIIPESIKPEPVAEEKV